MDEEILSDVPKENFSGNERDFRKIRKTLSRISVEDPNYETPSRNSVFTLSWSHYIQLMKIDDDNERDFYEIEATQNNWSVRELIRQFNSALYERLALSKDKDDIKQLAQKGKAHRPAKKSLCFGIP